MCRYAQKQATGVEKRPIGERNQRIISIGTIRFVTYDIWRITENEVSGLGAVENGQ